VLVEEPDRRGNVRWDDYPLSGLDERHLDRGPIPDARFAGLEPPLSDASSLKTMEKDFSDWVYRSTEVHVQAHETLKVYAGPDVPKEDFAAMCEKAAAEKRDAEVTKITKSYEKKIERVQEKLRRETRELEEDKAELSARKQEELGTHLETVLGLFGGRRKSVSSSLRKRRMTSKAESDVEESEETIEEYHAQLEKLAEEQAESIAEIEAKWAEIAADVTEIPVTPYKKDVSVTLFGVAWFPYHLVDLDGRVLELPGFGLD
jgi:hypothetical protein